MVRFYFYQFLCGFGRHIPLVAMLALVGALVFIPDVNKAFGLRNLLWHEDWRKQCAVGFALGVLVVQVILAGYLLETQRTPGDERPRWHGLNAALTYALGILACTGITLLPIIVTVIATWDAPAQSWPLVLGCLPAFGMFLVGLYFLPAEGLDSWVGKLGQTVFRALAEIKLLHVPRAEERDYPIHGVAVLAMIASVFVYAAVGFGPFRVFSPLVGVFALAGMLTAAYGFFEYFLDFVQPALALVLIGLIFMGGLGKHSQRFPRLEPHYAEPVELRDYDPVRPVELVPPEQIRFCSEARGPYPAGQKRPLVLVCVSGGGLRAAAWTTAVLHELERAFAALPTPIDFPCHIRIITGASGGMVGAGYYVANLTDPPPSPFRRSPDYLETQYKNITEDCLSPLIHALTYHDLRGVFSPFGHPYDRGQALEDAWTRHLGGAMDLSFEQLREGETAGWRPSLIYSPMLVEDGRRMLISNLDLRGVASNDGAILQSDRDPQTDPSLPLRKRLNRFSYESYEFFRLFTSTEVRRRFTVATAARMSASFPYVSPSPTLPTTPRRRVVDAGYYDNDGVSLAAAWVFSGANRDWLRRHASKIVLVQIRDGASADQRRLNQKVMPETSSALSRGFEFLSTPPSALFSARVGSSSFRNDGLLEILSQQLVSEMQVKPLLADLREDEIQYLLKAKERETAMAMVAGLDAEQRARLTQALRDRRVNNEDKSPKIDDTLWLLDAMPTGAPVDAKLSRAMRGMKLDNNPNQWADRMLRAADLQAASLGLQPHDLDELRRMFAARLRPEETRKLLERVRLTFDRDAGEPYFATIDFEFNEEASLSWYLTTEEKARIRNAAGKFGPRIKLLTDWWQAPAAQDGAVTE
jgi:hypothetical protein